MRSEEPAWPASVWKDHLNNSGGPGGEDRKELELMMLRG